MFITRENFKYPFSFDHGEYIWSSVEIATTSPWFLAAVKNLSGEFINQVLISKAHDALFFAQSGHLMNLTLAIPNISGQKHNCDFIQISEVAVPKGSSSDQQGEVFFISRGGAYYSADGTTQAEKPAIALQTVWGISD